MNNRMHTVMTRGIIFLAGVLAGAGTGLLYAPQSGVRTRRRLKELAGDIGEQAGEVVQDTTAKFDRVVEQGKRLMAL